MIFKLTNRKWFVNNEAICLLIFTKCGLVHYNTIPFNFFLNFNLKVKIKNRHPKLNVSHKMSITSSISSLCPNTQLQAHRNTQSVGRLNSLQWL